MKTLLLASALAGLIGSAHAQTTPIPTVQNVGPADVFSDAVSGVPGPMRFATAAQINGVLGYQKLYAPATGFTVTFSKAQTYALLYPTATLATGSAVLDASPGDGQRDCVRSTQAVTAFSFSVAAGSGQTINNNPTALTANASACMLYSAFNATWDPA